MAITLTIKEKKDYPPESRKMFNFLTLLGNYNVVGSASIKEIEYADDYDLNEMVRCKKSKDTYTAILDTFREKYKIALKSDNIYITDFKCGERKSVPIRWNKQTIKQGWQMLEDTKIYFTDCLQQKSTIKLDIIVYENKTFVEYSEMYLLSVGDFETYDANIYENVCMGLKLAIRELTGEGKFYKALKRYMSYLRLRPSEEQKDLNKVVNFLNSSTGQLSSVKADLEIIKSVMEQTFKPVPEYQINNALESLKEELTTPLKSMVDEVIQDHSTINEVIEKLNEILQKETLDFIQKNNLILF